MRRRAPRWLVALGLLMATGGILGCEQGDPLGRLPVRGTVTLDGEPLDEGVIQFLPTTANGSRTGGLVAAGRFDIPAQNGLLPGTYKVTLNSADKDGEPEPQEAPGPTMLVSPERIPARYNRNTELEAVVKSDGANQFQFDLASE